MLKTPLIAAAMAMTVLPAAVLAMSAEDFVRVQVRPGWQTASGSRMAAIEIILAPGWKTYWRQPGDAGIPPVLDLSGSANLANAQIHWPMPTAFDQFGMTTLGYAERVVLPLELMPREAGEVAVSAHLSIGICNEVCVPADFTLDFTLDGSGRPDPAIEGALATMPATAAQGGYGPAACDAEPIADGLRVTIEVEPGAGDGARFAVIETGDPTIWVSPAEITTVAGRYRVAADLVPEDARPFILDRSAMRLTLLGDDAAVEFLGCQTRGG